MTPSPKETCPNETDYCRHCNEQYGDHRARDHACPVILERRGTYSHDTFFEPKVGEV